ncbi:arsenate reductase family protein [Maribacter hydrothermalis]|uniref:Arsenate reductase, glutaredoxin family n=1 Tax=Maribacter hydrothermalis TaxID=1836467 RepID=A0A1B7Z205_9FLAO|nr:hypothetical protein [Maribacter hydrothermalis]APQ19350.1 hypothetical protein BTR34_12855 [Maribacter hydrothermalis]OBR36745.1 hypothetical protein A9200_08745 [Maribacter hydrothermalis]
MGVIAKNKRKIILYYNSESSIGKQTLAYVTSSEKDILSVDISKTKVTGTQWAEIANGLNINISDLINTNHPDFVNIYGKEPIEMEEEDWLKILEKEPNVLAYPIIIKGNRYVQLKSPSNFLKYIDSFNENV